MKTITGIHGVPRSGTSWLAQIFNSSPRVSLKFQPLFSYSFKDYLNEDSTEKEIDEFFESIYKSDDYFINMRDEIIHKHYPQFNKKEKLDHLVFKHVRYHNLLENLLSKNEKVKFILVLRNPMAVLSSWKKAKREFSPEWDFEKEWKFAKKKNRGRVEEYFGYFKWKEAYNIYLKLKNCYPNRISLVVYKKLLQDTVYEVERMFEFANIPMSQSIYNFIDESKTKSVVDDNSVFRIKTNDKDWQSEISNKIRDEIIDDLKGSDLEFLLK